MRSTHRFTALLVAGSLALGGCYGPFNLTRKVHQWNGQIGDKWANEIVFLVLAWLPVYSIATLADAIVFNSIEFWTGENPVSGSTAAAPQTKRIVRGDSEAVMTRTGDSMVIEQFEKGRQVGMVRMEQRNGLATATDAAGHALLHAQRLPDGSVTVSDAKGRQVAWYSAEEVRQLASAARN